MKKNTEHADSRLVCGEWGLVGGLCFGGLRSEDYGMLGCPSLWKQTPGSNITCGLGL